MAVDMQSALIKLGIVTLEKDGLEYDNKQLTDAILSERELHANEMVELQEQLNEAVEAACACSGEIVHGDLTE